MANPEGGLPEIISPYLLHLIEKTGGKHGPIGKQFFANKKLEKKFSSTKIIDPFLEDTHEVAPGLVYKYKGKIGKDGKIKNFGRALWTVTRFCGSYCRFCFRGREVGSTTNIPNSKVALRRSPTLSDEELEQVFYFIKNHPELNEVIISGGDPFFCSKIYLEKIISGLVALQKTKQLDIIRIGTRLPIQNPLLFRDWHYKLVGTIKNPNIMLHVNHPAELSDEALLAIQRFRRESQATIFSQTVLLKGVNDNVQTLVELFNKLAAEGIRPYYLFQNDPIYWAKHFTVPLPQAIKLWSKLRPRLSGLAGTVKFTIEVAGGMGKIPLPEAGAWNFDKTHFKDFRKKNFYI
jgi:lysine 2,3-aminomutase